MYTNLYAINNIAHRMSWRRIGVEALCLGALAGLSGCVSLTGRWTGDELQPEMARDQYKLLQPAEQPGRLVSADIRLQKDGSYTAEMNYDGNVVQSLGKWTYDDKGYVSFVDKEGRSYGYTVRRPDDKTLEMVKSIKGTDAILTLKKQPSQP